MVHGEMEKIISVWRYNFVRILIVGAGGIGGFFGGHLVQAGADVTFLVRQRRAAQLEQSGLVIDSPLGNIRTAVRVVTGAELAPKPDLVLLACKAFDLPQAMETIAPAVGPSTIILPLLNGLAHMDHLGRRFPRVIVWGGLAHLGVTLADDGTIKHLNNLSVIQFGAYNGTNDARAQYLVEVFSRTPVQASARPRIQQDMWGKFVFLSTLAGMTCLMRASVGVIMATPSGERLTLQLLDECSAVAAASGFPPAEAQLATYRIQLTQKDSASKASMLRDIERGDRTEGEHVLGDMLIRAQQHEIRTPLLEIATTHVRAYERSR